MTNATVPQIFADCCAIDGDISGLNRPFWLNGKLYATDGRIVIRGDFAGDPLAPNERRLPVDLVGWPNGAAVAAATPVDLPAVGHGTVACGECKGTKRTAFYDVDAGLMRTEGVCHECEGSGVERDATPVEIAGVAAYQAYYLALLRRNGVMVARPMPFAGKPYLPGSRGNVNHKIMALYFAGDRFEGLLVGLRMPATVGVAK